jgi:hypothetical protein
MKIYLDKIDGECGDVSVKFCCSEILRNVFDGHFSIDERGASLRRRGNVGHTQAVRFCEFCGAEVRIIRGECDGPTG